MSKLLFQLSTQVASKENAALEESPENSFFEENICFCDEDFEDEEIPADAIECDKSECADRKMLEWDAQMQNVTCICDDDDDASNEEGTDYILFILSSTKW